MTVLLSETALAKRKVKCRSGRHHRDWAERPRTEGGLAQESWKVDKNNTPGWQWKAKENATEILSNDNTIIKNITKKPAVTGNTFKVSVAESAYTGATKPNTVVQSEFIHQLEHKLQSCYAENSMKSRAVERFRSEDYRRLPCFCDNTAHAMYYKGAPFFRVYNVPKNYHANVLRPETSEPYLRNMSWMFETPVAVNERHVLKAVNDVRNKSMDLWVQPLRCLISPSVLLGSD